MLARVTWALRLGACALIGVLTFLTKPPTGPTLSVGIAVMAAVAGLCCTAPHGGAFIGFVIVAVLAAAAETNGPTGWATAAIAVLSIEISALLYSTDNGKVWQYPLTLLVVFIAGRNRRAYLVQATQSAALVVQLKQLRAEQRQVVVLDERNRIAREIHDVLAHSLGALGIHLQATRAVLESGDVPRAQTLLEQAQRMATDGLVDTRRAVQALRGDMTRLDKQLAGLIETHRERHATSIDFKVEGEPAPLPPEITVALIRTAQEGLVNTAKHAPHQPIDVRLSYQDDEIRLWISNPMAEARAEDFSSVDGGFGLVGMRERLLLINGTLTTGSDAGWWTIFAQAPR
jgi:signal transduction histidine kinase